MLRKLNDKQKKMIVIGGVVVLVVLFLVLCSLFVFKKINLKEYEEKEQIPTNVEVKKDLNIIDTSSNARPIAVMVNNHPTARQFHSGLQDAYIVYELIVEGGLTRYMAVYKDATTAKIGSVRSARHYYLDYALENDAIYVHFGWSPQAQSDISSLGVNNINGLYDNAFWRDKSLGISTEHTAFTSMEKIASDVTRKGYRTTSDKKTLLNYSTKEVDLSNLEGAKPANNVNIRYSASVTTSYTYDAEAKVYKRSVNGKAHTDYDTKEQYTAKNIITYQVTNSAISGDKKGRQEFNNLGEDKGYYISNGYAVPIKWKKDSRSLQTVYTYLNGEEIDVNDGNTYIQIQPTGQSLTIE